MVYEHTLRRLLFWLSRDDPEKAHDWMLPMLAAIQKLGLTGLLRGFAYQNKGLQTTLFQGERSIRIPNPIGLAAGFDKNLVALKVWEVLGAGHVSGGTVLPRAQPGNQPRPRMERIVAERALRNALGFPTEGNGVAAANRLATGELQMGLGLSVGKQKETHVTDAAKDYTEVMRNFSDIGADYDWQEGNPSSPNTTNNRSLQEPYLLRGLIESMNSTAIQLARRYGWPDRRSTVLKFAPDIGWDGVHEDWGPWNEICVIVEETEADGVSACNTYLGHGRPPFPCKMPGGYSGPRMYPRTLSVTRYLRKRLGPDKTIIAVGGIETADQVFELLLAGADAVQIFTAFVYQGPSLFGRLNRGLAQLLEQKGYSSVDDLRKRRG